MNIQPIIPHNLKQNIENKKDNIKFTGAFDAVRSEEHTSELRHKVQSRMPSSA